MQELIDQLLHHARNAWRYRWWALATAWAISLIGWAIVGSLDDVYEAEASVYVDTTSELRRLLDEQIVEPNVEAQVQYVRQALLGSAQLRRVAESTDLLLPARSAEEEQQILDRLAGNIQIEATAPDRRQAPNLYRIAYQHPNRDKAIEVVKALLNTFIEDTLQAQLASSNTSRQFLTAQVREYEQRLSEAEQRLADFNRQNFARLPSREGGYFDRLQSETGRLEETRQRLREAQSKLESIEQQLVGAAPQVTATGEPAPDSIEGRIQRNQTRLDELLLQYTENHPDVAAVEATLERLRSQREQQLADIQSGNSGGVVSNNPVYQALLIAKNETRAEIAKLQADLENRERQVAELRGLIDEMPGVEAELARLTRDYDVINAQYQSLLRSLEREKLSREAQTAEQVDFRVITPPHAGTDPVAPMRLVIVPFVLVLALGAGAALAVVLSLIKRVFSDPATLETMMNLPVLGSVTYRWPDATRLQRRRDVVAFAVALLALLATFSGVFVVEVLGPGLRNFV